MLIAPRGMIALRSLGLELQEEASAQFPETLHREMMLFYDICHYLQLNIFQCRDVLGQSGWQYVHKYISTPIDLSRTPDYQSQTSHPVV